ncbi:hypothetical protein MKZ02_23550 [Pseudobacillus sp. FSL P4-0506]|uniref:hypothetical protein n=1 Tax=unclassified Pseudobacillus TaxID=2619284 RepID=UPI0030F6DB20
MRNYFNVLSIISFVLNMTFYAYFIFKNVSNPIFLPLLVVISIMGIGLAWYGEKSLLRTIALAVNLTFLLVFIVFPILMRTFIWNRP